MRIKPSDPVRRYARSEIVEVTTEYTPRHEKGRRLISAGKIAEAKVELAAAMNEEDRPWVRREILATQVKCALWNGDYLGAVSRFLPIVESDRETFHFSLVPLCWTSDEPPANIRFDAREWIGPPRNHRYQRLIGASWLLLVADGSAMEAEQMLKRLAKPDVRIQRLAQMQLWRLKLKKSRDDRSRTRSSHWDRFVEDLSQELRGGSYFVIGEAWKNRKENERAARAYLWLPLVFDTDRWLSSRACYEAADSLNSLGDPSQAANLYSEVIFRYGDTPWGAKAEVAWKAIKEKAITDNEDFRTGIKFATVFLSSQLPSLRPRDPFTSPTSVFCRGRPRNVTALLKCGGFSTRVLPSIAMVDHRQACHWCRGSETCGFLGRADRYMSRRFVCLALLRTASSGQAARGRP